MRLELVEQQLALVDYTLKTKLESARRLGLARLGSSIPVKRRALPPRDMSY